MAHAGAGPFDPPIGRQSSVVVLSRRFNDAWGDYRVVTTISTRSSTNVLEVNSSTGTLLFAADHSFTDEASALAALTRQGYMEIARGTTLLGYTATDTLAGLLLATKITTKATLPGGHAINLVSDARWELLPLNSSSSAANNPVSAAEEQEFWRSMQQHAVGGVHYYCETADITRPFPSAHPPTEPELEFVWNAWLSQPLKDLGLPTHCPALMQGAVEAVDEVQPSTGKRYTLCLLSRRSRRHPGTRYIARGLNEMAGPGNEIEAELIMWTPSAGSSNTSRNITALKKSGTGAGVAASGSSADFRSGSSVVKWARVAWRRGTVPIWWGVELQPLNKGLQAEVYVKEDGPYVGMLSYVRALQKLCTTEATGYSSDRQKTSNKSSSASSSGSSTLSAAGQSTSKAVTGSEPVVVSSIDEEKKNENDDVAQVTFINLLHCNPKKAAELMLSSHFEEGMLHVKARLAAEKKGRKSATVCSSPPAPSLKKFDWHGVMAFLNEEQGIEAFWSFIEHSVKNAGLAVGVMERRAATNQNQTNSSSDAKKNPSASKTTDSGGSGAERSLGDVGNVNEGIDDVSPWGEQWNMRWLQRQRGLLRFNCADSLDRTNAATCFAMLPTLHEGLRLLGIQLETSSFSESTAPLGAGAAAVLASSSNASLQDYAEEQNKTNSKNTTSSSSAAAEKDSENEDNEEHVEVLPEGWERRDHAGRAVYIDHVNRVTQWEPPPGSIRKIIKSKSQTTPTVDDTTSSINSNINKESTASINTLTTPTPTTININKNNNASEGLVRGQPWAFFNYKLEDVRSKLHADALSDYVTMFQKHGDVHSALYTGSAAMHSHVLGLVLAAEARPYGASSSSVGKLQNLKVAVQRRWNNTVSDTARQQSMELFLGLNVTRYFPRVTPLVPPHHAGVQTDLGGIDSDDTLEEEEEMGAAHVGAELENLHLKKHDGRVGVEEEIINLEQIVGPPPPPPPPPLPQVLQPSTISLLDSEPVVVDPVALSTFKDDDEEETLDPLGAVKSPMKLEEPKQQSIVDDTAAAAAAVGGGNGDTQYSLI